jgi:hypothetical protein
MADLSKELYGNAQKQSRAQELAQELYGDEPPKNDVLKSAAIGVPKGLIATSSMPRDFVDLTMAGGKWINEKLGGKDQSAREKRMAELLSVFPSSTETQKNIESVTGKFYKPKTKAGEYAEALTTALTSAGSMGGKIGLLDRLIAGGLSGVGAKAGSDVAGTPGALVGGMIAPSIYGLGRGMISSNPADMLKASTQGVTEQQWQAAQDLIQKGKAQGITITVPEALNTPAILGLAGDVRSSPSGSATMTNFLNERASNQVQPTINNYIKKFPEASQREAGTAAQMAATDVISKAEKANTAAWKNPNGAIEKTSDVLQKTSIPSNYISGITDNIDDILKHHKKGDEVYNVLTKLKTDLSGETNALTLFNTKKILSEALDAPMINNDSLKKSTRAIITPIEQSLNNVLKDNVPQYKEANNIYANMSRGIDELNASPIGAIAGKHGFEVGDQPQYAKAKNQLFGASNSTSEVGQTANYLSDATPKMTNAYLREQSNLAGNGNMGNASQVPQNIGARFADNIASNPAQRDNLMTVLKTIDKTGNTNYASEAKDLIATLESTGRIPGVGSPTTPRAVNNAMAARSNVADAIDITKGSIPGVASTALKQRVFAKTYKALSEAITKNDVPQIKAIIEKAPELRKQLFTAYVAGVNSQHSQAEKETQK